MDTITLPTEFLPVERADKDTLEKQRRYFENQEMLDAFVKAAPDIVMVLNKERQIVYSNQVLLDLLGIRDEEQVCGFRPGEILDCVHAFETEGGCGTTSFCTTCGAAKAIAGAMCGKKMVEECRIIRREQGDALDLRVWTTPYEAMGERFTIFFVNDISHEKRRQVLERIFFHDILNTAGGLLGISDYMQYAEQSEVGECQQMIYQLSNRIVEEIKSQRELVKAENNELSLNLITVNTLETLEEAVATYREHEVAKDKGLQIADDAISQVITTDATLLSRVIGNLIKNALEASETNQVVTVGCNAKDEAVEFWVQNTKVMPSDVQKQIFQRSFSTKGAGRGLGTYSIKLLTERYLKGKVSFTSEPDKGTIFRAEYPVNFPE